MMWWAPQHPSSDPNNAAANAVDSANMIKQVAADLQESRHPDAVKFHAAINFASMLSSRAFSKPHQAVLDCSAP